MKKNTKETNKQITTAIGSIMYIVESAQKIPMAIQLKHLSKSQETSHIKSRYMYLGY